MAWPLMLTVDEIPSPDPAAHSTGGLSNALDVREDLAVDLWRNGAGGIVEVRTREIVHCGACQA